MSKFKELCKAYETARINFFDYRRDCHTFASKLIDGLIDFLQCPKEQIKFIPLKKDYESDFTYTLMGAMHLNDDTFWHLGVGITLYKEPNIFPHETVLISFLIKEKSDSFTVKLGDSGKEFEILKDKPEDFNEIYEFIFNQIKETYEKGLKRFLEQKETSREIGF